MALEIVTRRSGVITVLEVSGRITLGKEADHLRKSVIDAFESGHQLMVVQLAGVQSADSAGVGELVSVYASITRRGGSIRFLQPSKKLRAMFHVTGLDDLLDIYDDEQQALASFGPHNSAKRALVE